MVDHVIVVGGTEGVKIDSRVKFGGEGTTVNLRDRRAHQRRRKIDHRTAQRPVAQTILSGVGNFKYSSSSYFNHSVPASPSCRISAFEKRLRETERP